MTKFLAIILTILVCSCSKQELPSISYTGNWKGIYSGQDNGTITINIDNAGTVTGTAYSIQYNELSQITGSISSTGTISATTTGTVTSGTKFTGNCTVNNGSGTWNNPIVNMNGSWSASKQ